MADDKPVPVDGPTGEAPDWIGDFSYQTLSTKHIDGIDEDGDAIVISETDVNGRYIASTLSATAYIDSRR